MTEWQMINSNDKEIRTLGICLFKQHATMQDIEDAIRLIDTKYYSDNKYKNDKLKKEIIEDIVAHCWNVIYKDSDYYNGAIVYYLIKYSCDITKRIEELKEELENDRETDDIFQ